MKTITTALTVLILLTSVTRAAAYCGSLGGLAVAAATGVGGLGGGVVGTKVGIAGPSEAPSRALCRSPRRPR